MELSILALIGIGLGTMFFGYFFGLFEGRGQGYKKRRREEAVESPGRGIGIQSPVPRSSPAGPHLPLLELGSNAAGQPTLKIDGRAVDPANVASDQRKRLIELMVALRPWIEPGANPLPSADQGKAAGPGQPMMSGSVASSAVFGSIEYGPGGPAVSVAAEPAAAPPSASLVQQIDAILQARMAGTTLAGRGIRLAESLRGGAIVFIGRSQFDGVDKVPDPEVQAAIRAAIAEWEERSTPS